MIDIGLACLLMGFAIGIDVALATFLRANTMVRTSTIIIWIMGVTMTHTLFPLFGYLLAYVGIIKLPVLTPIIGLVAFLFIAYFISQELVDKENESNQIFVTLGLILAVSWDALWSGPAKSAQVVGWPELWVWLSFIIVGLVVMSCACISYILARYLARNSVANKIFTSIINILKRLSPTVNLSQWLQISIVSYFGFLALLRYTLSIDVTEWKLLLFSSVVMAMLLHCQNRIRFDIKQGEVNQPSI